jgi:transcription termination factor NusA
MAQAQAVEVNLGEMLRQIAHEKEIEYDRLVVALEDSMASAAKKQYRVKEPVRARFDPETGKFEAWSVRTVVEEVEDPTAEWTVEEALAEKPDAQVGDEILKPVSTEGLGRIAAQSAKQVLYQRVRETEREKVYIEFIDRVGEVVNGTVKRFERGDVIVDLGRTEAIVPRPEQSRHERWSQGERIRAVIVDVHKQPKGPQIVLSRTDPRLLVKLFEMEVPEIYDGTVVIKAAVRAPGERAKVAVYSRERDVDPVGACVGMKGSRVQAIIRELRGEKIDIIEHSDDLVTFAQSSLAPAKITRVSVHHTGEFPHLDVIVEDEQLSLAIGKRGHQERDRRQGRGHGRPRSNAPGRSGRRACRSGDLDDRGDRPDDGSRCGRQDSRRPLERGLQHPAGAHRCDRRGPAEGGRRRPQDGAVDLYLGTRESREGDRGRRAGGWRRIRRFDTAGRLAAGRRLPGRPFARLQGVRGGGPSSGEHRRRRGFSRGRFLHRRRTARRRGRGRRNRRNDRFRERRDRPLSERRTD